LISQAKGKEIKSYGEGAATLHGLAERTKSRRSKYWNDPRYARDQKGRELCRMRTIGKNRRNGRIEKETSTLTKTLGTQLIFGVSGAISGGKQGTSARHPRKGVATRVEE